MSPGDTPDFFIVFPKRHQAQRHEIAKKISHPGAWGPRSGGRDETFAEPNQKKNKRKEILPEVIHAALQSSTANLENRQQLMIFCFAYSTSIDSTQLGYQHALPITENEAS